MSRPTRRQLERQLEDIRDTDAGIGLIPVLAKAYGAGDHDVEVVMDRAVVRIDGVERPVRPDAHGRLKRLAEAGGA